jgi:hypothetical protein
MKDGVLFWELKTKSQEEKKIQSVCERERERWKRTAFLKN